MVTPMTQTRKRSAKIHRTRADRVFDALLYAISLVILIIIIYPLYFIIVASFSNPSAVTGGKVWFWPVGFTLDGYKALLEAPQLWTGYGNTILYAAAGTFIALVFNIPAAYALSRKDLYGRRILNVFFLIVMFFSGGLIPTFLVVQQVGLYNTFWVMVLPFSISIYNIMIARTFFDTSLPGDLHDAAQMDGCNNLRFFFQIVIPLSKAIIAVIALWTAIGHWNSYFNALIYLRDPWRRPLQLVLRNILITNQRIFAVTTGEAALEAVRKANLLRYTSIIVSTVPILAIYPFAQKYFAQGVMIGAVKG
ncbi:MAG: carbohydrate ABC transporter permease [Eubacteriales bacterium]|jgi:putative aldouronate transport system permease protein|nr:carbohydrate ABC transporter permease [Eubacteriales bacterium]MDD4105757.1 carbohydrate ABC transporter permease [Eubacteriales bacterium]MDD4710263.1 carbohydrate ABC transporter permease [Eubacteriales bacterium]